MIQTANKRKSTLFELRKKEGFIYKNVIVVDLHTCNSCVLTFQNTQISTSIVIADFIFSNTSSCLFQINVSFAIFG